MHKKAIVKRRHLTQSSKFGYSVFWRAGAKAKEERLNLNFNV